MRDLGFVYNKLTSERGDMSLMGALIAITIMCAGAFIMAQMTRHGAVGQRVLAGKAARVGDSAAMRMILGNPELCRKAFWDAEKKADGVTPEPKIAYFNPDGPVDGDATKNLDKQLYTIKLGNLPWQVEGAETESGRTHLYFSEIDSAIRKTEDGKTTYAALLTMEWERAVPTSTDGTSRAGVPGKSKLTFPMYVKTDASTHQILECGEGLGGLTSCPAGTTVTSVDFATRTVQCGSGQKMRTGHFTGTGLASHEITLTATTSVIFMSGTVSATCTSSDPVTAGIYGKMFWDDDVCNFGNSWSTYVSNAGFAVNVSCLKIVNGSVGDHHTIKIDNVPYGTGSSCLHSGVSSLDYTIIDSPGLDWTDETPRPSTARR